MLIDISILRNLSDDDLRMHARYHMSTVMDCLTLLRTSAEALGDDDVVDVFDDIVLSGQNILTFLGGE